ncbi:MAG: DNA helicase UvrD [Candidatus Omnitrophica bacterium CG08_land_8_20_14_0_20_41_16]|uniref:DNA helicase UvrD n=1 Tax=Candidatus Sherwoodlollariibacterium unditelluris TaxID=1974757 RepID=A0A2G9YHK3_9BACT|nr:MAG: DNA helicase UvrD [Candidatus Omnitrophica bacterium CG23_combo_of_CG06-09_8_20_14_all_41_10]PIS34136.1 MAG: DNA helicase UvrD [Candidatus Omnitrophica bacterium CG08_land_8_20_14_0_20_41_16]
MEFIADFHIHSRYSRATSRNMDVKNLSDSAKLKGITLMGTGDFTHHLWLEELKNNLEDCANGLYKYNGIYFILTSEISSIYSKRGKTYRIHNLIFAPSFKTVDKINDKLGRIGNLASDGRPILGLDAAELARIVFNIDENCMIVPAHIYTPWFSLFGSMSGFDRIEDCFEEQTPKIFACETGLSSDPAMSWRLSALDKFTLISNSDAHSPQKIGREANVFNCELNYKTIREILKTKDKSRFLYTIEFFPEEGKYHFDGHRLCGIRWSPKETREHDGKCPKCGKPVTVGVVNRVEKLADRPEGFRPEDAIPFKSFIPLDEIIADAKCVGKASAGVEREYRAAVAKFGTEFEILMRAPKEDLLKGLSPKVAKGVLRVREGKVNIKAGFDGEYGIISIFDEGETGKKNEEQLNLF